MQRFVYTPHLSVFIHNERSGRVIDVSDDVISGSVQRRLNALSTAEITIQNKQGKYLARDNARFVFDPMDRIVIYMSRLGAPMPVFSGFLDESPYYQLYPGPVTLRASDSLKLLQYTFFDPGVKGMFDIFAKHGWQYDPTNGTLYDPKNGSFGNEDIGGGMKELLEDVIETIGGWNKNRVKIQELPPKFITAIAQAMAKNLKEDEEAFKGLEKRLKKLLSISDAQALKDGQTVTPSTGGASGSLIPGAVTGNITAEEAMKYIMDAGWVGNDAVIALAVMIGESNLVTDVDNKSSACTAWPTGERCLGLWQINGVHLGSTKNGVTMSSAAVAKNPALSTKYAFGLYAARGGTGNGGPISRFYDWQAYTGPDGSGADGPYLSHMQQAQAAYNTVSKGGTATPGTSITAGANQDAVNRTTPNADSIATKIVQIAVGEANKGIRESGGENKGPEILKYQQYTGTVGQAWCASFVSWVYSKAGMPSVKSAGAINLRAFGSLTTAPQPGDIVTFDGPGNEDHAGIVTSVSGSTFSTVEGNSSDGVNRRGPYTVGGTDSLGRTIGVTRVPGIGLAAVGADQTGIDGSSLPDGGTAKTPVAATPEQIAQIAKQSAWFTLQFQGTDFQESSMLTGKRALANDISLLDWFQRIIPGSGRVFTSMPDGSFLAFYPDYFGYYATSPYFRIADIEVVDLTIQRNDTELTTHVFATGPFLDLGVSAFDKQLSQIASVEEPAFKTFVNVPIDDPRTNKNEGLDIQAFMTRYGARPFQLDLSDIRNPILVWMAAWMKFSELWSKQFTTNATFTFLPELLPGGLVAFGDRISMFVEDVTHNFDRTAGFSTSATLTSPASIDEQRFPWLPQSGNNSAVGVNGPKRLTKELPVVP